MIPWPNSKGYTVRQKRIDLYHKLLLSGACVLSESLVIGTLLKSNIFCRFLSLSYVFIHSNLAVKCVHRNLGVIVHWLSGNRQIKSEIRNIIWVLVYVTKVCLQWEVLYYRSYTSCAFLCAGRWFVAQWNIWFCQIIDESTILSIR